MSALTATLNLPLASASGTGRSERILAKERVVANLFEAFSERSLGETLHLLTEDVVFTPMTARATQGGAPYVGHEGMRRYLVDVEAQWEQLTVRPTQIKAAGDAVVALGLVSGSGPAGRFEDAPTTWMFKFRDERVASVQIFSDPSHVSRALGAGSELAGGN